MAVTDKQEFVTAVVRAALDKKAFDAVVLDISKLTIIADYFIILSGRSPTHVRAVSEYIVEEIEKKYGCSPRTEGMREGRWILLDYGDVVVHIFLDSERLFYNLERLWGDAPVVAVSTS